jgi:membrane protease YdiL (CAAX protease family)
MLAAWVWAIVWLASGHRLLPAPKPRAVPWGLWSVLLVGLFWFILREATAVTYLRATRSSVQLKAIATGKASLLSPHEGLALVTLVNLATLVLVPSLLRLTSGATARDLGIVRVDMGRNIRRGAVACLLLTPIVSGVMIPLALAQKKKTEHPVFTMLRNDHGGRLAALAVVGAVLLAPAAEELLFRGVLLAWLLAWTRGRHGGAAGHANAGAWGSGPSGALDDWPELAPYGSDPSPIPGEPRVPAGWAFALPNIVTSLVFAGLHYDQWPAPIPLFILSLGLGLLYDRTGSLWAPFSLHAVFNGLNTGVAMLAVYLGLPLTKEEIPPPAWEPIATCTHGLIGENGPRMFLARMVLAELVGGGNIRYPISIACRSVPDLGSTSVVRLPGVSTGGLINNAEKSVAGRARPSRSDGDPITVIGGRAAGPSGPEAGAALKAPRWWIIADRTVGGARDVPGPSDELGLPPSQGWERRTRGGRGTARPLGSPRLMSAANSKKSPLQHSGFEWAGAVARIRRSGGTTRSGRRSALLGILTQVYANSSRGARSSDSRNGSDRA